MQSLLAEFFADNLGDFFIFLRRFADDILETSADSLEHVLHFVTVFMGDVERYVQPQGRALGSPAEHPARNKDGELPAVSEVQFRQRWAGRSLWKS